MESEVKIEIPEFRLPFVPLYMMIVEHVDGDIELVRRENGKGPVCATETNQYLLREIGDRLLKKKLIIGYQLLKTLTYPTKEAT